ncbi:PREDICTED: trypsin alpha-3-like [Rhagoletis zephyria]|uniref:trypsin alpha-3-like n=1 Tax=Rhagoletis zephyria TaxID=28612 RepID=UPI0008118F77|nr:PREDICTED: trypsin alpha-3-like [Rhagoletis zephyria]
MANQFVCSLLLLIAASSTHYGWDNILVDVSETIIAADDCVSGNYGYDVDEVFASNVCGLAKNNKACNAIGGVPLVSNNQLVGLLSWGNACANDDNPAVFTNIFAEKSWIESNVNNL